MKNIHRCVNSLCFERIVCPAGGGPVYIGMLFAVNNFNGKRGCYIGENITLLKAADEREKEREREGGGHFGRYRNPPYYYQSIGLASRPVMIRRGWKFNRSRAFCIRHFNDVSRGSLKSTFLFCVPTV